MNNNHVETFMNGWLISRWSTSNSHNSNTTEPVLQFTQSEPSSPTMYGSFYPPQQQQQYSQSSPSPNVFQYMSCEYSKDRFNFKTEENETLSVNSFGGSSSILSTDFSKSSSDSTFLKLDYEDFIQTCALEKSTKPFTPDQSTSHQTFTKDISTTSQDNSHPSLPPKISKNSRKSTHSSSSSSLDSLVTEKRKRNKRSCLPGERKMIMWKWNKATIKEVL